MTHSHLEKLNGQEHWPTNKPLRVLMITVPIFCASAVGLQTSAADKKWFAAAYGVFLLGSLILGVLAVIQAMGVLRHHDEDIDSNKKSWSDKGFARVQIAFAIALCACHGLFYSVMVARAFL